MRRLVVVLVAAAALAAAVSAADARHATRRGHAVRARAALPAGMTARPLPARAGAPPAPGAPGAVAPAPGAAPPPPPAPPAPAGSGRALQARTDDRTSQLKLVLSRRAVLAGGVRVEFNNGLSQDPHDLLVERVDGTGPSYAFDELGAGAVATRTVALNEGAWRLRCTIPTHAERGMTAALTVSG